VASHDNRLPPDSGRLRQPGVAPSTALMHRPVYHQHQQQQQQQQQHYHHIMDTAVVITTLATLQV